MSDVREIIYAVIDKQPFYLSITKWKILYIAHG